MNKITSHWSKEFEQAVLGAVLYDYNVLTEIYYLKPQHFYSSHHALIYEQILKLKVAGEKVDSLTVSEALKQTGKLDKVGGAYFITGLSESCPTAANVDQYAKKVWEYALRRKIEELAFILHHSGDPEEKAKAYAQLKELDFTRPWEKSNETIKLNSFEDLVNDISPPPPQLIDRGLLPSKSILLLTGAAKAGKSILALNLALCLASGQDWFQFKIEKPTKVLVIQSEVAYWALKLRIQKMKDGCMWRIPDESLFLSEPFHCDIRNEEGYKAITEVLTRIHPEVVIFDPLLSFHNEDEIDNSKMHRVMLQFRELTFSGISIIIVHHSRKTSHDSMISNPRGASSIVGSVDSVMELSKSKGMITAKFDLRYDETPDEMTFKRNPETLWLERYNPEIEAKQNNAIIKLLDGSGNEGIQQVYIAKQLSKEFNKAERTVRRWISDLAKTGIITVQGSGNSKKVILTCNLN